MRWSSGIPDFRRAFACETGSCYGSPLHVNAWSTGYDHRESMVLDLIAKKCQVEVAILMDWVYLHDVMGIHAQAP